MKMHLFQTVHGALASPDFLSGRSLALRNATGISVAAHPD
jgi:hypothetical protein